MDQPNAGVRTHHVNNGTDDDDDDDDDDDNSTDADSLPFAGG